MRLGLLTLFALGAHTASAATIAERQLVAFQPTLVMDKLNLAWTAFNNTMHPTVGSGPLGLGPQVPTDYTAARLLIDLPIITTLMAVDTLLLVVNVVVSALAEDIEELLCTAIQRVLRIEMRLATRLNNVIQNEHGPLNSAITLPAVARALTGVRKATQNIANALAITLNVLPRCGAQVREEESEVNREFAGLVLTMHQKPNAVTTAVANELLTTLNIAGGITGSVVLSLSGKPNRRRSVDLFAERAEA